MQIGFTSGRPCHVVDVQKMARPHRFTSLKVNEVSVVTEPAILSQDESDAGVGTVVVKMAGDDAPLRLPESVFKAWSLEGDDDLWVTVNDLMNVVRMALTTHLKDPDAYWDYHAAKVQGDFVLMVSWWDDPYASDNVAYKCTYSRTEKTFKVDSISEVRVVVQETPSAAKAMMDDACNEAMKKPKMGDGEHATTGEHMPQKTEEPAATPEPESVAAPAPVEPPPAAPSVEDLVQRAVEAALAAQAQKHADELAAIRQSVEDAKKQSEEATTKLQAELEETRKGVLTQPASASAEANAASTYQQPKSPAAKLEAAQKAATNSAFGLFTAPFHNTINRALQGQ